MREVNNAAFNKELLDRINNLKDIVTTGVTPENESYFDAELIRKARDFIDNSEAFSWTDKCSINGVSMQNVNAIIRHLKTQRVSVQTYSGIARIDNRNLNEDDDGFFYTIRFKMPDGFISDNTFFVHEILVKDTSGRIIYDSLE